MVVFVCMSVHNGFTVEIYRFRHSLRTFLPRAAHDAIARNGHIEVEDSEDRSRRWNKSRDMEDG